jgi:hypothetical protein
LCQAAGPLRKVTRVLEVSVLTLTILVLTGLTCETPRIEETTPSTDIQKMLQKLPAPFNGSYSSDAYLTAASLLQKLGREKAILALRNYSQAHDNAPPELDQVFVLCRMLFVSKKGGEFRRPRLGAPEFLRGKRSDWPLEPVAIEDGIPFLVIRGYRLEGVAERPVDYLQYCESECAWNSYEFSTRSEEAKRLALTKLLSRPIFKNLKEHERQFFWAQLQ